MVLRVYPSNVVNVKCNTDGSFVFRDNLENNLNFLASFCLTLVFTDHWILLVKLKIERHFMAIIVVITGRRTGILWLLLHKLWIDIAVCIQCVV